MGMTAHPPLRLVVHPSTSIVVLLWVWWCFRRLLQLSGVVVEGQWWSVSDVMGCDGM